MQTDTENRSFLDYLILALKGFCMGASDVVPGVSGGTMAFILGIYEELINAIKSFNLRSVQLLATLKIRMLLNSISWQFLLAVGFGILTAIFTLARVLDWLLQNRPVLVWSFFLGLILASVVSVSRRIEKWSFFAWVGLLGGITGTYFLVGVVPVETPSSAWFVFLCGAVAICAMILPGISGSFVLVLLGKYQYVLGAVNNRDFAVLALVAAGACVGIVSFSRLLGWLLGKYHDVMVAILTGLMLGSLRKVWPWKETVESLVDINGKVVPLVQANILPEKWNGEVTSALFLMLAGLIIVIFLDRVGDRQGS
jgi:putative membrane protein